MTAHRMLTKQLERGARLRLGDKVRDGVVVVEPLEAIQAVKRLEHVEQMRCEQPRGTRVSLRVATRASPHAPVRIAGVRLKKCSAARCRPATTDDSECDCDGDGERRRSAGARRRVVRSRVRHTALGLRARLRGRLPPGHAVVRRASSPRPRRARSNDSPTERRAAQRRVDAVPRRRVCRLRVRPARRTVCVRPIDAHRCRRGGGRGGGGGGGGGARAHSRRAAIDDTNEYRRTRVGLTRQHDAAVRLLANRVGRQLPVLCLRAAPTQHAQIARTRATPLRARRTSLCTICRCMASIGGKRCEPPTAICGAAGATVNDARVPHMRTGRRAHLARRRAVVQRALELPREFRRRERKVEQIGGVLRRARRVKNNK